jgi:DNA polymerase I-like protein with 3'-5' exonuclease and polymerase domains
MVNTLSYLGHSCPVYITRHPAALIYDPDYYMDLVSDLQRCAAGQVPRTVDAAALALNHVTKPMVFSGQTIWIDAEASSNHFSSADLLCVTVADQDTVYLFDGSKESLVLLDLALSDYRGDIIGQNSPGDEVLLRRHGVRVRFTGDTLLRHFSQDERRGSHGLKVLAPSLAGVNTAIGSIWPYIHRTGAGSDKDSSEEERTKNWLAIPQPVLQSYCGTDAYCTAKLDKSLAQSEDGRSARVYAFLRRAQRAFTEGMCKGVRVDTARLGSELQAHEAKVAELRARFAFDPEKRTEVLKALQSEGHKVEGTSKSVLQGLEGKLPQAILNYRREAKTLTGFLRPLAGWTDERGVKHPGWVGADGVVHPSYKLFGAPGRTACANPNLQQIPQRLKNLFVARPGHVFIGWDMKQHEVRGLAYLSQDKALCQLLRDQAADPHQYVSDRANVGDRKKGKTVLFASAYGAGEDKLRQVGLSSAQAKQALRLVADLFPALAEWKKTVYRQIWEQGCVETPHYGRRRHFHYINPRSKGKQQRVAVNFLPQALCNDICMDGAIQVFEKLGMPPLIFVHDFNLIEVPEIGHEHYGIKAYEIARNVFPNDLVQFLPDIKVGQTWGDLHQPEETLDEGEEDEDEQDAEA